MRFFSIEGVWEGLFTVRIVTSSIFAPWLIHNFQYTEFTAYAALLSGAPPVILQKSLVVRHRQTWKLREHHLLAAGSSSSSSNTDLGIDLTATSSINTDSPLSAGDPLRSYFPAGTHIKEDKRGLEVQEPGKEPLRYRRSSHDGYDKKTCVQDIIITGEVR